MNHSFSPPRFRPSRWILATVLALLGAAACAFTLASGVRAKSWQPTPAKMVQCDLIEGAKGRARLAVRYTYFVGETAYEGTRVGFTDGMSKAEMATAYAAGKEVTCFVNPRDPTEVLLRREMGAWFWIFPGLFLGAGVGLGYGAVRAWRQQRIADAATLYSLETV
jgi:hypothetical protein